MAFFRSVSFSEPLPAISGDGVLLRAPQMGDYSAWAGLRAESRDALTPWEPTWPNDDLTRAAFRRRLRRYADDLRLDLSYPFFLFDGRGETLLGGITIANVRRGVAQAGSLGYWIGARFMRRGHMSAALRTLVPFAFDGLRLHRLEAACIPTNAASMRLLEKSGFVREGYARQYLRINGEWRDHVLYARLKDDPWPVPEPAQTVPGRP